MARSASERLGRFNDQFSGNDSVLIVINADPDAIGSAMAVSRLLWRRVSTVTISHVNTINRPDNLAMLRLLGVAMTPFNDIDPAQYSKIVIVDSQPNHNEFMEALHPDVIIDHHPETDAKASYSDIRPGYGATATILTEYLRAARITPSAKLATGLFQAIKTDTNSFKGQTQIEDVRAFQYLFRYANTHLARKIEQADLRLDFLKYFKIALNTKRLRKGRVFVCLGSVVNPDVCVIIADFPSPGVLSAVPVIKNSSLFSETTVSVKMPVRWPRKVLVNSARPVVTKTWRVLKSHCPISQIRLNGGMRKSF